MAKSLIPKSKAKTAYGLLSEIAALAIEEPKRIRMSTWLNTEAAEAYGDNAPACGTVGCIAGWGAVLAGTKKERAELARAGSLGDPEVWRRVGKRVFGLDATEAHELFNAHEHFGGEDGTPEHARGVVGRIRRFQRKYRARLLAKRVR